MKYYYILLLGEFMYKYIILVLIGLLFFTNINRVSADALKPIIYLDAGHGGKDGGADYGEIYEDEIVLNIAYLLRDKLENVGYTVYLTRDGDHDLATTDGNRKRQDIIKRTSLINESDATVYLSIHLNSSPSSTWSGAQVFYNSNLEENRVLSEIIQNNFAGILGNTTRKAKPIRGIYLIKNVKKIGALLECGFLSNEAERQLLITQEYQEKIAMSIYLSILEFYQETNN